MIEKAKPADAARLDVDARESARLVSKGDAVAIQACPGEWFEVRRNGSTDGSRGAARNMRNSLSRWYGGEWEAASRLGKLFVRFIA
jgi:hypothetical protein